jgi:carbamoyl-phosphate synthase large subunit
MNLLFSCVGKRSYIIEYFRQSLTPSDSIIGTSNTEWAPALRYCDKKFYMPDIVADNYIDAMLQLCKEEKIDALLSFLDKDVDVLAQYYDDFKSIGVIPILPKPKASRICFDKFATFRFLREQGINTPMTFLDQTQAKEAIRERRLQFPVIVKPQFGCASKNVFTAHGLEEMETYFQLEKDMMIQEMIQGEELDIDICNDISGEEVLAVVPWKKFSSRGGEAESAVTLDDPGLIKLGIRLGKAVGQAGPMDVDVFKVEDDYHVIDLNPRFGGGYPVTQLAGGDYPGMLVKMIRGENVMPRIGDYKAGVTMMKEMKISCGEIADINSHYTQSSCIAML